MSFVLNILRRLLVRPVIGLATIGVGTGDYGSAWHDLRASLPVNEERPYARRPIEAVKGLYIHHSATKGETIRNMAEYHIEVRGWGGLAYHYAVGWDGQIFWTNDPTTKSFHTKDHNGNSISVVIIGNYSTLQLTDVQKSAIIKLVDDLTDQYSLQFIKLHRDVVATQCPGNNAITFLRSICFDNRHI